MIAAKRDRVPDHPNQLRFRRVQIHLGHIGIQPRPFDHLHVREKLLALGERTCDSFSHRLVFCPEFREGQGAVVVPRSTFEPSSLDTKQPRRRQTTVALTQGYDRMPNRNQTVRIKDTYGLEFLCELTHRIASTT